MTHVYREYEVKINMVYTGVITTPKNCYFSEGRIKIWRRGDSAGETFPGGRELTNF